MTSRGRNPLALAPFHTLLPDKVLNNSYIIVWGDNFHSSALDNRFNFLQAAHKERPLPVHGPVGISHACHDHFEGYACRFTHSVVQRIRRCQKSFTSSKISSFTLSMLSTPAV
jgi:hypothetical protein